MAAPLFLLGLLLAPRIGPLKVASTQGDLAMVAGKLPRPRPELTQGLLIQICSYLSALTDKLSHDINVRIEVNTLE